MVNHLLTPQQLHSRHSCGGPFGFGSGFCRAENTNGQLSPYAPAAAQQALLTGLIDRHAKDREEKWSTTISLPSSCKAGISYGLPRPAGPTPAARSISHQPSPPPRHFGLLPVLTLACRRGTSPMCRQEASHINPHHVQSILAFGVYLGLPQRHQPHVPSVDVRHKAGGLPCRHAQVAAVPHALQLI